MKYTSLILLLFAILNMPAKGQSVNPTGVYSFSGKTYKKNGDTYGYFGTIMVLKLDSRRILVNFYFCKGAPSYNSGSFIDTLQYVNNQAVYRGDTSLAATTCTLTFTFSSKGVFATVAANDINWACGFGHAVDAHGFYKRLKRKIPTKEEMLVNPLTGSIDDEK